VSRFDIALCIVIGFLALNVVFTVLDSLGRYWLAEALRRQKHRPFFFLKKMLAEEAAKHQCCGGMVLINRSAFDALMRDMRKHKTPIIYSGRGVLIDGFRVLPARVEANATSYLSPEGCQ
jgi:hypothetical protein